MSDMTREQPRRTPRPTAAPPPAESDGAEGDGAPARAPDATPARGEGTSIALGLFSLGLGLGELVAPRALLHLAGVDEGVRARTMLRGLGAREVVVGVGLLAGRRSAPWLWARVAGGVADLALLGLALRSSRAPRGRVVGALAAVAGVTALDAVAAVAATREERARVSAPVRRSVTIARSRKDVYRFWRELENAAKFMADIESVEILDGERSRWSARGPAGPVVHWETLITEDRPCERLAWRSVEGADVRTEAAVRFEPAPGGRGTEVHLELRYGPPERATGRVAGFLWRAAAAPQVEADLARCKQLLETGHVVHSDASLAGGRRPARPAAPAGREDDPS